MDNRELIESTLTNLRAPVTVLDVTRSAQVITYRCRPGKNVRVNKVRLRSEDLAMVLGVERVNVVRLDGCIGIEVPRQDRRFVPLRRAIVQPEFTKAQVNMHLPLCFGVDKSGKVVTRDLATFPHLLIAGQTGSGKSIAVHSIIKCLLATRSREDVRLVLIDPKRVELGVYQNHEQVLAFKDDMYEASNTLHWATMEMDRRYEQMKDAGARDVSELGLYRLAIVIDELADLMLQSHSAEHRLIRLGQLGRAAGVHVVAATQRPTVDVVTGLIKANMPARLAFKTVSYVDSRVILDQKGAEGLLGKGDGLLLVDGELIRVQGCF